uniref:Putative glycosyltransferase n=1 Tax=viral metagenome TaxID=1070528 RepID=A0A6M3JN48_9ZZZZ
MSQRLLVIAGLHRTEALPHWQHAATIRVLKKNCETIYIDEGHIFDVGKARQQMVEVFLTIPKATHLLFVDDDIAAPKADCLLGMFQFMDAHPASIVSGLYYNKNPPHAPLLMSLTERDGKILFGFPYKDRIIEKNLVLKVGAVPAGFLLIPREVFEKIPPPWFVYGDPELNAKQIVQGENVGEDIYFSIKARKYGYDLWVDTRASLLHYVPMFVGDPELMKLMFRGVDTVAPQIRAVSNEYKNRIDKIGK